MDPRFRVPSQGPYGHPPRQHEQRSSSTTSNPAGYYPQTIPQPRYNGDGFGPETPRPDRLYMIHEGEDAGYPRGGAWSTPSYRNSFGRTGRDRERDGAREEFFGTPLPDRVSRTFDQLSRQYREGTSSRAGSAMPRSNPVHNSWRYDSLGPSTYQNRASSVHVGAGSSGTAPWSPARPAKPVITESTLMWLKEAVDPQRRPPPIQTVREQQPAVTSREADSVEAHEEPSLHPLRVEEDPIGAAQGHGGDTATEAELFSDGVQVVQTDVQVFSDMLDLGDNSAAQDPLQFLQDELLHSDLQSMSQPVVSKKRVAKQPRTIEGASGSSVVPAVTSSQISEPPASAPAGPPAIRLENWNLTMVNCKEPPGKVVRIQDRAASLARWVYVQGIKTEAETPLIWRTSAIANRIRPDLVQTSSGSTYQLVGPLDHQQTRGNGFSEQTAAAFGLGFPPDWIDVLVKDLGELEARQAIANVTSSQDSLPHPQAPSHTRPDIPKLTPKAKKTKTTAAPRSLQAERVSTFPTPATDDMLEVDFFDDDNPPDELTILATPKAPLPVKKTAQKRGRQSVNGEGLSAGRASGKKVRIGGVSDSWQDSSRDEDGDDENASASNYPEESPARKMGKQKHRTAAQVNRPTKVTPPGRKRATPRSAETTSASTLNNKGGLVSRELLNLGRSPFGMMKIVKYAIAQASPDSPASQLGAESTTPSPSKQRLSWGADPEDAIRERKSGRRSSGRARRAPDPKWWIVSPGVIKVEAEDDFDFDRPLNEIPRKERGRRKSEESVDESDDQVASPLEQSRKQARRRVIESTSPAHAATPAKERRRGRVIEDTPEEELQQSADIFTSGSQADATSSPSAQVPERVRSQPNTIAEDDLPVPATIPGSSNKTEMTPRKEVGADSVAEDELASAQPSAAPSGPRGGETLDDKGEASDLSSLSSLSSSSSDGDISNAKLISAKKHTKDGAARENAPPSPSQPIRVAGRRLARKAVLDREVFVRAASSDYIGGEADEEEEREEWEKTV